MKCLKSFRVPLTLTLCLLMAACGQAEKKSVEFGKGDGNQEGVCAAPSFYRENLPAITDPSLLPKGSYRLTMTEVFFREEGGDLRAHFSEGQRGNEFVSRKICTSALPARTLFSMPFQGLHEFSLAESVSYRPFTATIFGERENFSFSRSSPGEIVKASISEILAKWSHYTFYKLSDSEYELRLYVFETFDERRIMKLMTLRFSFTPALK